MKHLVFESAIELLATIGAALGATIVTIIGIFTEHAGIQNIVSGQLALGAWEVWMGAVALFVGVYLLGYQEFWQRFQRDWIA